MGIRVGIGLFALLFFGCGSEGGAASKALRPDASPLPISDSGGAGAPETDPEPEPVAGPSGPVCSEPGDADASLTEPEPAAGQPDGSVAPVEPEPLSPEPGVSPDPVAEPETTEPDMVPVDQLIDAGVSLPMNDASALSCADASASCPPARPCETDGLPSCNDGEIVCLPGAWLPDGTPCGDGLVCNQGECDLCDEGASCRMGRRCHLGTVSCSTGVPQCEPSGEIDRDCWEPISTEDAPTGRTGHASAWTGDRLLVWGGYAADGATPTGGTYDPLTDQWEPTRIATSGTAARGIWGGWSVWFGDRLFIGGGSEPEGLNRNSVSYDPLTGDWGSGCPGPASSAGFFRTAIAIDGGFVLWGGSVGSEPIADAIFCSGSSSFSETPLAAAGGREENSAVWSGAELLAYGGRVGATPSLGGARYEPVSNVWSPIDPEPLPSTPYRWRHVAAWIGSEMIVWGGFASEDAETDNADSVTATGSRFDPTTNEWSPVSAGGLSPRSWVTGVVVGERLFVWGGSSGVGFGALGDGALYDPVTDEWTAVSSEVAPSARALHSVVSTGDYVIVWGGSDSTEPGGVLPNDGAIYYP
jgi:hypothetical protein